MSKQEATKGALPITGYVRQSQLVPHIIPFSPGAKVKSGVCTAVSIG